MNDNFKYVGEELKLFEKALNWKKYFSAFIRPYIHGSVLECGAGIGATTKMLNHGDFHEWVLLEPDKLMAASLNTKIKSGELPQNCKVIEGTILSLEDHFDTIIYIDVLEHIEKDKDEIDAAVSRLNNKGTLIILSPAFEFLFSKFDQAIGHHRRFSKKELERIIPIGMKNQALRYIDSMGFFASLANKLLLRQEYPSKKQILFWDKYLIPFSKVSDRVFNYSFGKSILGIWQKSN